MKLKSDFLSSDAGSLNLFRSLEKLSALQTKKLEDERHGFGYAKSDVVLIVPYTSPFNDKEQCFEEIRTMREQVPGKILIISYGGTVHVN